VEFLGHVVSAEGVTVDPSKAQDVHNWEAPKKVTHIRRFPGLAGYYCHFIKGFSKIGKLMTELLKKDRKFLWLLMGCLRWLTFFQSRPPQRQVNWLISTSPRLYLSIVYH
jgi:hypothetical protein